jgi:hypothetical protein
MVLPLRSAAAPRDAQRLALYERSARGITETVLEAVRFVPLETGKS